MVCLPFPFDAFPRHLAWPLALAERVVACRFLFEHPGKGGIPGAFPAPGAGPGVPGPRIGAGFGDSFKTRAKLPFFLHPLFLIFRCDCFGDNDTRWN